jgi:protein required for attachment to host cells
MGTSRGAYEGPDYHQKEEDRFALEAAQRLERIAENVNRGIPARRNL